MSSIKFDATLNTDQLESAIKQSNRAVKDWAKDVEKAGEQADRGLGKMTKSFKQAIIEQKQLIQSIEQEIKKLQKAYDEASAGQKKSNLAVDLRSAKSSLAIQNEKLLDLQKQQIDTNTKEVESVKGLTGYIKDWALQLGGVMAGYKLVKDAIMATTTGINAFNIAGAVMKQVMYNLVTGASSLSNNIWEVVRAQKELNKLRFEEKIYSKAALLEQIEYDKSVTAAHDQTLSTEERINAYDAAFEHLNNVNKLRKKSIQDEINALTELAKYQQDDEKLKLKIADLEIEKLELDHRLWSGQKEISSMRSGLLKKQRDDEQKQIDEANKNAIEDAKIENKLKKDQELLSQAIINNDIEQQKAISKRIVALQQELNLRQEIAKAAIGAAIIREEPINPASIPNIPALSSYKVSSVLSQPSKPASKYIPGTNMLTREALAAVEEAKKKYAKDEEDRLKKQLELRNEITDAAASLVSQIGEQLGLTEDQQKQLDGVLNTFTSLVSGDFVGAAFSLLSNIISIIPSVAEKFSSKIEYINKLLVEQQKLIDLSQQRGGEEQARKDYLELLRLEKATAEAGLAKAEKSQFWFGIGKKAAKEFRETIEEVNEEIRSAEQEMQDFLTGTDQRSIASAIMQGFKDSESSIASFADTFYSFMRNSIDNALEDALSVDLTDWYEQFATDMASGGGLTDEEISKLKKWYDDIFATAKEKRDAAYAVAGIDPVSGSVTNTGLSGHIARSITEETGTELAALFRRFADEQRVVKDYSVMGVNHLVGIEKNTYDTVARLDTAIVELKNIVTNTKQVPAASL